MNSYFWSMLCKCDRLKKAVQSNMYLISVILSGIVLATLTYCTYLFQDGRDPVSAFYGTCMLVSLQGQDDAAEDPVARILIGFLSLFSGLIFAVILWCFNEQSFFASNDKFNLLFAILGGMLLGLATFLTYMFVEERNGTDSFYGTCMLLSLLGQDDTPETSLGMILIGVMSILSSFLFAVVSWAIIEQILQRVRRNRF